MAEEIVNKLGFNVEDALSALQRLDNALQTAGGAFQTFGAAINAWNTQAATTLKTMQDMASAATRLAGSMSKMGSASTAPTAAATPAASQLWLPSGVERPNLPPITPAIDPKPIQDANEAVGKLTISWGTLSRIVMTQFIVRAMSQIRDALREAVAESIEFQRRIAEVQTVAPRIGGSFALLTSEAAEFAKAFNIPLAQATEGLYETISDQFSGMSERAGVMSAAMKLAKVGVMDFQDAVTLLTGTLNAFGMTSEQADAVAAKYFTTINLGHVRGKELADTMGQVIPIASQLGISLDELNAAMIAMTIGGMDAHKTVTTLRGAMTAFLKPSEDMKKVIREMGFTSAEQVVQAKGFQGALEAVADASNNMASEIAKSFRNVRALTAELRLTGAGAVKVEEAMKAMAASTPDALDKIYKQFTSTDSERLTREVNRLKITLTQDFGSTLTGALATMMQLMGGADRLSAAIQSLAAAAVPAAVALIGLAGAAAIAHFALGPIGWTLLGITSALSLFVGGMTYTTAQSINETRRLSNEQHQATIEYLKNKEEELRALRETEEKKTAEENRAWENRAAVIRREYFKALDDLRDKNKEIIESDRQAMQSIISSQERVVAAYRHAANAALRVVQESQNRRAQLEGEYTDFLFREHIERDLQMTSAEQADAILRRSWELQAQANRALAAAQTEDDVRRAQAVAQRAKAYLDEGAALAKETGQTWLQEQAHRSIRANLEQRIAAEKQLETLQAARAQALADEAANEQQRLDQMKSLMKAILSDLQAFDKRGAKSPQALQEQQARLTENIDKFRQLWLGGEKVDVADLLAFDQLQRRVTTALEGGISEAEVKQLYSAPETFARFREDIEQGIGPVRLMVETAEGSALRLGQETKGMTAEETIAHYSQELQRSTQIIGSFNASRDALKVANSALERSQTEIKAALDRWANVGWVKDLERFGGVWALAHDRLGRFTGIKEAVIALEKAIDRFTAPGAKISTEDLDTLQAAYDKYLAAVRPSAKSKAALHEFMKKASSAAEVAKRVEKISAGVREMEIPAAEARGTKEALEDALKEAEEAARRAKESTGEAETSAEDAGKALSQVSQIDMGRLLGQIEGMADAMWNVASASAMVRLPAASEMTAAHGGIAQRFLAAGGAAGTDVIPAMLSPGEFVVNAVSARRFASQLVAMNAGIKPVFRSEGGNVTNIGDINVTVSGGGSSRQTARSIAAELRRELRRGASTL